MTRRERLEHRLEKRAEWAAKRKATADASYPSCGAAQSEEASRGHATGL